MMLTIHGLPVSIQCQNLKTLITQECGLSEFILDNLVSEANGTQKVRIVVADEDEGLLIMNSLDGFNMEGQIIKVQPFGKSKERTESLRTPSGARFSLTSKSISPSESILSSRRMSPCGSRHTVISDSRESLRKSSLGLRISPSRQLSTPDSRYSPSRWSPDMVVRPAQESETKVPNQATCSGVYRPGVSFSNERCDKRSPATSEKREDIDACRESSECCSDFDKEKLLSNRDSGSETFDKKFEDIYNLAVAFVNKAQELRKREGKRQETTKGHFCGIEPPDPRNCTENELKETVLELFQGVKRIAPDISEIPSKSCRRSSKHNTKLDEQKTNTSINWEPNSDVETSGRQLNMPSSTLKNTSHNVPSPTPTTVPPAISKVTLPVPANVLPGAAPSVPSPVIMVNPSSVPPPFFMINPSNGPQPLLVNPPFGNSEYVPIFEPVPQNHVYLPTSSAFDDCLNHPPPPAEDDGTFHLYLCKDNVGAFYNFEVNALNDFLVSQIFQTTASSNHAPNFTFKGLQTPFRYELVTKDTDSKDWLLNLDFRDFTLFNVIVYLHEELCYERAAIWLSGHSGYPNIEPLTILKLQNQHLEELQIDKWKFVKKIVTMEGTRLYVDLPPASAHSLKQIKTLSYELQQANFYLRALAVDKQAFDAGFNEPSITDPSKFMSAIEYLPIPTLKENPITVKITLESKSLSLTEMRIIREKIINMLFDYLKAGGKSKTDFINYGFISPCYFGIVPCNFQSKKWLLELDMGKLNGQSVIIIDSNDKRDYFFQMTAVIPLLHDCRKHDSRRNDRKTRCMGYVIQNLKQSNKGVKGINFDMWKGLRIIKKKSKFVLDLEIDIDSMNTLAGINFVLDYVQVESGPEIHYVNFEQRKCPLIKEDSRIKKNAVVDVENISSDDDNDIICLGEVSDISENEIFDDDNLICLGEVSDISDASL